jgi:inhibitor of KinA
MASQSDTQSIEGAYAEPVLRAAGDSALLIAFGDRLDPAINNAAIAFDARLRAADITGVSETAPTIRSVLVRFDPLEIAPERLRGAVAELLAERDWLAAPPPARRSLWRIPACYGGEHGPDLDEIADLVGCSPAQAAERHAEARQRVFMLGFAPGVAYLGLLPEAWNIPRLKEIRPEMPAGSLLVAVRQTVLFAAAMPTGWRAIACTPFRSFDPRREPPVPIAPGDEIGFVPVDATEFAHLRERAENGESIVDQEELA